MLLQRLQEILELKDPLQEANRKLVNTYMKVNGRCVFVSKFDIKTNSVFGNYLYNNLILSGLFVVESLETWLPSAGIYKRKDGKFFWISRIPRRQWYKSFNSLGYSVSDIFNDLDYYTLMDTEKVKVAVLPSGQILIRDIIVGVREEDKIICTNSLFLQELKDLKRDGYI